MGVVVLLLRVCVCVLFVGVPVCLWLWLCVSLCGVRLYLRVRIFVYFACLFFLDLFVSKPKGRKGARLEVCGIHFAQT